MGELLGPLKVPGVLCIPRKLSSCDGFQINGRSLPCSAASPRLQAPYLGRWSTENEHSVLWVRR